MKRLLALLLLLAAITFCASAEAQTAKTCRNAATSGNASCIGIPDTSAAVQENLPSVSGTANQIKKATGSGNTAWASQNSLSYTYISCTPTFGSVSTGVAEVEIGSCEVPGGLMSANGTLNINAFVTRSATSNTDTIRIRIGTANDLTGVACPAVTSNNSGKTLVQAQSGMTNLGSVSTNACYADGGTFGIIATTPTTPNVNTANPFWVVVSAQPGVSVTDQLALVGLSVEYKTSANGGQ
jgi:hypothetical protein